ncbi:MAG: hypothetical protein HY423_00495 [Candidatus Lambdaproteobacteria bacterium]|nr:hypothetical protein [Candidatus Lambdaproteobacteria bacterium]
MDYVRYIDKTREYYRGLGYTRSYQWAHYEGAPFTPLRKPLAECRVALVSTAGFTLVPEGGFSAEELARVKTGGSNVGSYALEVWPIPSEIAEDRILYVVANHDRSQSDMSDANTFFPVTRLREFRDEGVLGSLATNFYRLKENYSQRKTVEVDAPEVLRLLKADRVDAALLSPV